LTLGERLRRIRQSRNLSLYDVEAKTGLHFSTIGKYERGERTPNLQVLRELAAVYQVSLSELLGEPSVDERPELVELMEAGRALAPEQVERLVAFLHSLRTRHPAGGQKPAS
jgi:transcriptional regulator with XRE-family HTH domain